MYKSILLALLFSSPYLTSHAQTSNFVTASQSGQVTSIVVDWSIGELITESFLSNSLKVDHGVNEVGSIFIVTGDLEEASSVVNVYPIPFNSDFFIETSNNNFTKENICLLDATGRIINPEIEFISVEKIKVDARTLSPGFYLLTLRTNSSIKNYRLIKK
jgi:hypothetical protein